MKTRWFLVVVIVVYLAVKAIPAAIERIWPEWVASKRVTQQARIEEEKAEREQIASDRSALVRVYERLITQQDTSIKQQESVARFMSNAAVSVNGVERALDANTREVSELAQAVRLGPRCPLPGCPLVNKENAGG